MAGRRGTGITALAFLTLGACEARETSAPRDPSSVSEKLAAALATTEAVQGSPTYKRGDQTEPLAVGVPLRVGDIVQTKASEKLRARMTEGSVLALGPDSSLEIARFDVTQKRKGTFKVALGRFWMEFSDWKQGETDITIETPNAVAGVRGTTLWGDVERDLICALEGSITVQGRDIAQDTPPITLDAGACASKLKTPTPQTLVPKAEQVEVFLKEVTLP